MQNKTNDGEIDLEFLRACLKEAGDLARGQQRDDMAAEIKPDHTPVTKVDHEVEDLLIERISARYPGHQILTEESGLHPASSPYTWIIDPIDGTRSFAEGLPIWGVSIGIMREGEPYAGGLYMPVTGDTFWGTRFQAYHNNRPLPRLTTVRPDSALVFLAVPSDVHLQYKIAYPRIRSLGSTAAHLAYAAMGVAVGVVTHRVGLWDLAGLLPVLAATGIEMITLSGKVFHPQDMLDGRMAQESMLAAHPSVMKTLREAIQEVK